MNIQSENLRALCAHVDHRAGCGKCEICLAADQVEQLEIKNAELEKQRDELLAALNEINNWLVCACIATPEDMAQSFQHMQQVADAAIDSVKENVNEIHHETPIL